MCEVFSCKMDCLIIFEQRVEFKLLMLFFVAGKCLPLYLEQVGFRLASELSVLLAQ